MAQEFPTKDYKAMLMSCHQAAVMGIPSMERWKPEAAARMMAILQVFGNNEGFTLSPKFNADREYIQEIYHIDGGEIPDKVFASCLKEYVSVYERVKDKHDRVFIEAAEWIKKMYGFNLYV